MDRHPQQIKRERQDKKRRERNVKNLSRMSTLMKNVFNMTKADGAEQPYREAVSFVDKMASIKLIHKNNAARKKARLTKHVNTLS